jgi:hypothetical protein
LRRPSYWPPNNDREAANSKSKKSGKNQEAKAVEKEANAERLKTPQITYPSRNAANNKEQLPNPSTEPPATQETGDTTPKGPTKTPNEDPKILLDATKTPDNIQTPEEEATNVSYDYTLSEEGEGDNIIGNKELHKDGTDEDENNLKRAKGLLQIETAE